MHVNKIILFFSLLGCMAACREEPSTPKSVYRYLPPTYDQVKIESTNDTMHFLLNDSSYNDIESQNAFDNGGIEYLSFFDQRSSCLLIYQSGIRKMACRIPMSRFLKDRKLYKTSVFVKNFDSILITNNTTLYLFDSSGRKIKSFRYLDDPPNAKATLSNDNVPVIADGKLYTAVRPSVFDERLKVYRRWKALYQFSPHKESTKLSYNIPGLYNEHLYGYQYLYSSFCYNHESHFVFSFAADTNIYETNLAGYHIAYCGKSKYQEGTITWRNKDTEEESYKNFMTHQAYGAIYFDPNTERYLRIAKRKISVANYISKNRKREQSIIVFDKNFRIIGESPIDNGISLSTLFFTKEGKIYARTNYKDENELLFVRLAYVDNKNISTSLVQKNSTKTP